MSKEASSKTNKILRSSAKMALATFSSRILGLVREQVMAAYFGASGVTDAFTIAYRVPNMLRDLFAEGAFSSAFVPVFTEVRLKDEKEARRLLWSLFVLLGGVTSFFSILIIIFAPEIINLVTNDLFTSDGERLELTVGMVRIMAPFLVLISLAALFMGALNTLKVFFVPSLAPAFFNLMMISCMIFLPPVIRKMGYHPIFSMAIGVIAGGLAQLLVQLPLIIKKHLSPMGPLALISESSKKIAHRLGIGIVGIAATQINVLITTILATGTQIGAVSWLTYAFRLFQFPVGILSVSVAGSNLVHFSDAWKSQKKEQAIDILQSSYLLSFFVIIPALALLYVLADSTVHLVFERGAFDYRDTINTTSALRFYLVGLPFYGLYKIFVPCFFTLDRPKIPVAISMGSISLNIVFCWFLTPIYGHPILALGTSLSMIVNSLVQCAFLKKLLNLRLSFFIHIRIVKIFIGGFLCALATNGAKNLWFSMDQGFFMKSLTFSASALVGLCVYGIVLLVLGEWAIFKKVLRRK